MVERSASVLAIFAHPDDIEFRAAGTLLQLGRAGFALHCLNISSGNCGSMDLSAAETARVRAAEAMEAAELMGAKLYPSLAHDLEIVYEVPLLRRVAAVVREAAPTIVLTHALQDYMEDHMAAARLAVTAAFSRGMPNFLTDPRRPPVPAEVTVYHATPHGLCDPLGRPQRPAMLVDTGSVHARKREALAAHRSQKEWLDQTQGMDSYLAAMDEESQALAAMGGRGWKYAEGWTRHSHLGFCEAGRDPLREVLGEGCQILEK